MINPCEGRSHGRMKILIMQRVKVRWEQNCMWQGRACKVETKFWFFVNREEAHLV